MSAQHPKIHEVLKRVRGTAALIRLNKPGSPYRIYCLVLHPNPEVVANIQSLYSRDPKSIEARMHLLSRKRAREFMAEYYTLYGHKSIADCGNILLFFENVPLHFAKLLQRDPRYTGQEASTRYIDFATVTPLDTRKLLGGEEIYARLMQFYNESLPVMLEYLEAQSPLQPGESERSYKRAIRARAFDILRGFLPLGVPTNVSWNTSMRAALDDLRMLSQDPDIDVARIAQETLDGLQEILPGSFSPPHPRKERDPALRRKEREAWKQRYERYEARLAWQKEILEATSGTWSLKKSWRGPCSSAVVTGNLTKWKMPATLIKQLAQRPAFAEMPYDVDIWAWFEALGLIDYGSFRDLQRHRALIIPIPTLTTDFGFEPWYIEQLAPSLQAKARALLIELEDAIRRLPGSVRDKQPYTPIGYRVPVMLSGPIRGWIWVFELRSKGDVHPTLRRLVHAIIKLFRKQLEKIRPGLSKKIAFYEDCGPDDWRKRGTATFVSKKTGDAIGD